MNYLSYADLSARLGVPENTLRVWVNRGKFPKPDYKPTDKAALWLPETIEEWEHERSDQG